MVSVETDAVLTSPCGWDAVMTPAAQQQQGCLSYEERQALILANLPEVRYIARHIHSRLPPHVPFDDLVHAGVLGLIDSLEKFDPSKNVQLKSYARYRIRGAILDSLRELDWGPRRLRKQGREIEKAKSELLARLGRFPRESEVAAHLELDEGKLQGVLAELSSTRVESLQRLQEFGGPGDAPALRSNRTGDDPFAVYVQLETRRLLTEAMDVLDDKERRALTLYFFEERTMKEVGEVLSVCESRVSQIISGALIGLRARLEERLKGREGGAQLRCVSMS
jgi:RNA polymerase sigma factor FliA